MQSMKDNHVYIDEKGVEWNRVFLPLNNSIDTKIDCFSKQDLANKTAKKGMTLGDMWDLSKEMSNKREKSTGKDPVKEKYFKKYSENRNGMKHGNQKSES